MNDDVDSRGAALSPDGMYRYELTRKWACRGDVVTFVMLNPSTADAMKDDPTIRRCIGFARREGFSGLCVVNLYAFRATNPRELEHQLDPVGPWNEDYVNNAITAGQAVVAAWGAHPMAARGNWKWLRGTPRPVYTLGQKPNHPLYLPADTPLVRFTP